MGGSWGGAGLQGTLPGQRRPEVAFCRQKAAREDGKVEMLTLLIAMNPTAASPTEKWTQGLLSAFPTEGTGTPKAGSGCVVILRERLSCPPVN